MASEVKLLRNRVGSNGSVSVNHAALPMFIMWFFNQQANRLRIASVERYPIMKP